MNIANYIQHFKIILSKETILTCDLLLNPNYIKYFLGYWQSSL